MKTFIKVLSFIPAAIMLAIMFGYFFLSLKDNPVCIVLMAFSFVVFCITMFEHKHYEKEIIKFIILLAEDSNDE